jgi:hypothetical protein
VGAGFSPERARRGSTFSRRAITTYSRLPLKWLAEKGE